MYTTKSAAESLEGITINNKWKVIKRILPEKKNTGGCFSAAYVVEDEDGIAFLKAIDFNAFFSGKGNVVDTMKKMTDAYTYERDLLHRCRKNSLSKISMIIDEGEVELDDFGVINKVPYLVFHMADGDIRTVIDFSSNVDLCWKLKSLHDICVGLKQLHGVKIGHQDIKPSNILLFDDKKVSKIGDLGRSLCQEISAPHDFGGFVGDPNYSPPEYYYGFTHTDWNLRVKSTDFYLFGSMITFYFSGLNMTTLLLQNTSKEFWPGKWGGDYTTVLPYLLDSFQKAIIEFKSSIEDDKLREELPKIVEYCCHPNPSLRGYKGPKGVHQLDFQRTISKLDLLHKQLLYKVK
ncbi:protein kinase domain-containing protein [Kaistella sp.]|uniref:protein kinase domain-containing protein n=1 Tax=Kaistella sp. TaxID=2782235 RepID=UPI002F958E09